MLSRHHFLFALSLLLVITGLLSGCGLFRNNSDNYLKAREMPPLVVPDEKDSGALGQIYPIPHTDQVVESDEFEVPRPQPVSENVFEETVKIQSFGGERWILINHPPGEIWPRVRNILNRSGIATENVAASEGLIETAWIQFKNDDATSHRFRFSIEPAVQMNSTEIKIRQMQTAKGSEDSSKPWPNVSDSIDREQEIVEIISNALASDISGSSVSLLAQSIGGVEKVRIVTPRSADPYIEISLDYERAWASVNYSLSRGGFAIDSADREGGLVQVSYIPESLDNDEPGFFSRLFSFGSDEQEPAQYTVRVRQTEAAVQVRITDTGGSSLKPEQSSRLLKVIRGNLS